MRALTAEQEQSVARRAEPLLLSAAAGSGKTSVLVERFVRAVREDGVAPGKILAITFTERAAGELRERVRTRFLELGEREAARDTEAAFVGTFHGFCARLLRAHPLMAGLDPDFAILDEGLAGRLRERAFRAALRDFLQAERVEAVDLLAAYAVDRVHSMIEGVHAQLRSQGQRTPRLPLPAVDPQADPVDAEAAEACALLDELLVGFGRSYEELKRGRGAVDFDDLELCARELLEERESVRAAWSERFELLMVDEFQDTNPRQLGILHALDRGNLFTVGDEFQSIYGFRHAEVRLFRARRAELAGRGGSLALTRNFRSRAPLLDVVNVVFEERFVEFTALVAGREDTDGPGAVDGGELPGREPAQQREPLVELLLTARRGWEEQEDLAGEIALGLPPAALWRQAEARLLAQRVAELVDSGQAQAGEVVVLLRAVGDLEVYERALQLRGLRTLAAVGGFWEHQQVGDLLAYLRALANPLDEEALYATLASPLVGLSRDGLALLARAARAEERGAWETALRAREQELLAGLPGRDRDALVAFCARLQGERGSASRRTISELVERAIDASGYREHVLGLEWGERRLANVHKLLRFARRFEASEGRDLRAFLDHVAHLRDVRSSVEPDAPVEGVEPDAVRLMSIHAAKGLEFPVVCVADLGRAPNMRVPDLLVDGDRVGLQLMRLDGAKPTPSLDFEQLCEQRRRAEAEEEDRILYVAMTRARERLVLSGAVDFERWPEQRRTASTISWLGPALAADLPALVQAAQWSSHDLQVGPAGAAGAVGAVGTAGAAGTATVRCLLNAPATVGTLLRLGPTQDSMSSAQTQRAPSSIRDEERIDGVVEQGRLEQERAQPRAASSRQASPLATLSYTSLSELERCGYRYYLERILGLREDRAAARALPVGGGLEARARGTLVHRLLESFDFARPGAPSPEHVARIARELGMRVGQGEREEIAGLIGAACSPVSDRPAPAVRVAAAQSVRREHTFAFSLGRDEPLITGVIDLLAREADGGFVVLDYKSDRVGLEVDLSALVEREYGIQRLLYALAVLREGAAKVEIVHWFLQRPHDWVGARYTAADRGALEERLAERLAHARAQTRTFSVSRRPHRGLCLTCPGRAGLCSWGEKETLREDPGPDPAIGGSLLQDH
jgi:ATP-dependent exoDNAse (exonuclease V) beta subunit